MGYIYKITNKINGKVYIGQTVNPVKTRMRKHYSQANTGNGKTGIDAAIRKYGKDNFEIETICECKNSDLDKKEMFYIQKYNSFKVGYNLTTGGQLKTKYLNLDENEVVKQYKLLGKVYKVAEYFECCSKTITDILQNNHIKIKVHPNLKNLEKGWKYRFQEGDGIKKVKIIEFDMIFNSLKECSQWLIDNKYSKASTMEYARKSLSRVLNNDGKTYCGLHFEFVS